MYKKCTHLASLHVGHGSWTVENSSFFHLGVMDFHSMFSHATHVLTCCTCGNECTVSVDSGQVNPSLWRVSFSPQSSLRPESVDVCMMCAPEALFILCC